MNIWKIITTIFAGIAIFNLGFGLARLTGAERFYRASAVWEDVTDGGINIVSEVTLEAGQSSTVRMTTYYDEFRVWCLTWEANRGRSSVKLTNTEITPRRGGGNWRTVSPYPLCIRKTSVRTTVHNDADVKQVIRVGIINPPYNSSFEGGYVNAFCQRCKNALPLPRDLTTKAEVTSAARTNLFRGVLAGGIAYAAHIGPTIFLGWLIAIAQSIFPSRQTQRVREELNRMRQGEGFDADATRSYAKKAPNAFRRQQDIHDLEEIIEEVSSENKRLREEEDRIRAKRAEEQRLIDELNEAVEHVEKLQRENDANG